MKQYQELKGSSNQLEHISNSHPKKLLETLNLIRCRKELCDVVLEVGSKRIFAHRVILSACSPYFYAMFNGELQESKQTEVVIRDIDENAMEILVEFAYASRILIAEDNVQVLLPAACLLQMTEIQNACCEFLKLQLDPSNCLGIRAFADTHSCEELFSYANKFALDNFQEVIENEEFLLLPIRQLIDIISSDELNVRSEEQVFKSLRAWVHYDLAERKKHFSEALQHVRLCQLNPRYLVMTVSSDILIKSDEACRDLVDEAKNYLLLPNERPFLIGSKFKARKPDSKRESLFAVGGWCAGDAINTVERLDPKTGKWTMVASMSKRRCGVGVCVLNGFIYAVGGHDGNSYLNSIERYDTVLNTWSSDVEPTKLCRTSVGVANLNNELYAIGGQDHQSCLDLVEKYNPFENKWTKVASMHLKRLGVAVAVLDGYLYAIGGSNGNCPLNSVERYDPKSDCWTYCAPMNTRRKHLGCAVYDDMIYVVGGRDEQSELSSAERYDPELDKWMPVVAMNSKRSGVGLAVVNEQLYAVGGFDGKNYLKTVEVYNFFNNCWTPCESMNFRRLGGGVAVCRNFQGSNLNVNQITDWHQQKIKSNNNYSKTASPSSHVIINKSQQPLDDFKSY